MSNVILGRLDNRIEYFKSGDKLRILPDYKHYSEAMDILNEILGMEHRPTDQVLNELKPSDLTLAKYKEYLKSEGFITDTNIYDQYKRKVYAFGSKPSSDPNSVGYWNDPGGFMITDFDNIFSWCRSQILMLHVIKIYDASFNGILYISPTPRHVVVEGDTTYVVDDENPDNKIALLGFDDPLTEQRLKQAIQARYNDIVSRLNKIKDQYDIDRILMYKNFLRSRIVSIFSNYYLDVQVPDNQINGLSITNEYGSLTITVTFTQVSAPREITYSVTKDVHNVTSAERTNTKNLFNRISNTTQFALMGVKESMTTNDANLDNLINLIKGTMKEEFKGFFRIPRDDDYFAPDT